MGAMETRLKATVQKTPRAERFISVYVPREMKERLWAIAEQEGVKLSVVVRSALQFFLEHYEYKEETCSEG